MFNLFTTLNSNKTCRSCYYKYKNILSAIGSYSIELSLREGSSFEELGNGCPVIPTGGDSIWRRWCETYSFEFIHLDRKAQRG